MNGPYYESPELDRSADDSLEFTNLVASVKRSINRPPLPDIIERPKSSLPYAKVSPLTVSPARLQSLFRSRVLTKWITGNFYSRRGRLSRSFLELYSYGSRLDEHVCVPVLRYDSVIEYIHLVRLPFGVMTVGVVRFDGCQVLAPPGPRGVASTKLRFPGWTQEQAWWDNRRGLRQPLAWIR